MDLTKTKIRGGLQLKIMLHLKEGPLCGIDLMKKLNIKSPGTIYPVLNSLEKKGLVSFKIERTDAARKKVYYLTEDGEVELKNLLSTWRKFTCCDWSPYINRFIEIIDRVAEIKKGEKILCTLDAHLTKEWLKDADVTYSTDTWNMNIDRFDKIVVFIGTGIAINQGEVLQYLSHLRRCLKDKGILIALEVERTDNIWSERYFVEIMGFKEHPGMTREEFRSILERAGFRKVRMFDAGGVLVSVSEK